MKEIAASKAYRLLESGPVVLLTTMGRDRPNIMTIGFHMVVQHDPPLIACVVGPWDYSYKALKRSGECVIAIPEADLARKVVDIGNCSGAEVDKFRVFRLTAVAARKVNAPRIAECLANLECKVANTTLVRSHNLFVLDVIAIALNTTRTERRTMHHNGDGTFTLDGRKLDLRDRMVRWKEFQVDL